MFLVIFLLMQVSPAAEEEPKPPQGVELLFPIDDGAVPKDKKKKDAKAEKAAKRQAALLKKLKAIEKGGDINAADKNGQTALMQAAAANNRLAVCWLVAKGAKAALKNKKGKTARDLSTSIAIRELLRLAADEGKPLTEEEKKRYGADKPFTEGQLQESLCHTIPYVEDLANLIKMGAEPTAWDIDGTPLLEPIGEYCAAPESIAWLTRKGVDFTKRGKNGKWTGGQNLTPEALRLLLTLGAEPDLQNDSPSICLQAASELNDIPGIRAAMAKTPKQIREDASTLFRHVHSGAAMKAITEEGLIPADPTALATFARVCSSRDALTTLLNTGAFHFKGKGEIFGPKEIMERAILYRREMLIPQFIAAGMSTNGDYDLLSSAVNACNLRALRVLLAAGTEVSGKKNPLSVLFSFTNLRDPGNLVREKQKKHRWSYMNFPSRGLSQDSLWREKCERVIDFRAIIDTMIKLGCDVPDTLPLQFLNSSVLGCRKQGQNHCPDLPPTLSELLDSPEKAVRELLKLCGNKIAKNALLDSMFITDRYIFDPHADFTPNELVRFADIFLKAGADPNAVDNEGKTVLMTAGNIRADLTERLLAAGGNPNAVDSKGRTVLMYAARTADEDTIRTLLNAGARTDIKNKDGKTALQIARENKNEKVVKLLEERGVKE